MFVCRSLFMCHTTGLSEGYDPILLPQCFGPTEMTGFIGAGVGCVGVGVGSPECVCVCVRPKVTVWGIANENNR